MEGKTHTIRIPKALKEHEFVSILLHFNKKSLILTDIDRHTSYDNYILGFDHVNKFTIQDKKEFKYKSISMLQLSNEKNRYPSIDIDYDINPGMISQKIKLFEERYNVYKNSLHYINYSPFQIEVEFLYEDLPNPSRIQIGDRTKWLFNRHQKEIDSTLSEYLDKFITYYENRDIISSTLFNYFGTKEPSYKDSISNDISPNFSYKYNKFIKIFEKIHEKSIDVNFTNQLISIFANHMKKLQKYNLGPVIFYRTRRRIGEVICINLDKKHFRKTILLNNLIDFKDGMLHESLEHEYNNLFIILKILLGANAINKLKANVITTRLAME